jgi:hypothetical protein
MMEAVLVRVTMEGARSPTSLWIVATADRSEARRIVRERVTAECIVEASDATVNPQTLARLRLGPGEAWQI